MLRSISVLALCTVVALGFGAARAEVVHPLAPPAEPNAEGRPFAVGEKLTYNAKVNFLHAGTGTMSVVGIDTVRGHTAYHTVFDVHGGIPFYRVNDHYESWFDTTTMVSLRYRQKIDEGPYERERTYEMYPEKATFSENGKPEEPSVSLPLDDGSFIYFVRTLSLDLGQTYEFNRYFRPDRNPVRLEVVRKERIKVPAGEFDAIVVRPSIKTNGIFSQHSNAEIWFSNDSLRLMLRMKSGLPFGTLQLELKDINRGGVRE
ncbi:MAG TPA: DUF3108 domain-containing protein [Gemmatimonadaceae bacterium]|jgi:hypothetical protein